LHGHCVDPYRGGTINATCRALFTLHNRRATESERPIAAQFIGNNGCCRVESIEASVDSDDISPQGENSDLNKYDEASARLQSGLLQCHRVVSEYRAILSGDFDDSESFDQLD
jgi:hypothetical protein